MIVSQIYHFHWWPSVVGINVDVVECASPVDRWAHLMSH